MIFRSPLFTIAFRQLTAKKRQTILTISGIGVGVMVLITAISLMDGLLQSFIRKIIDNTPHIVVSSEHIRPLTPDLLVDSVPGSYRSLTKHIEREDEDVISNYTGVITEIMNDARIRFIAPIVSADEVGTFGTLSTPLKISGIKPSIENAIEQFSDHMTDGSFEELERSPDGIMIGSSVVKNFPVRPGDRVQLSSASGQLISVRVTGIFSTGMNEADNTCYVNLRMAQILEGLQPGEVTKLAVRVNELSSNTSIARMIEAKTNYKATTWE